MAIDISSALESIYLPCVDKFLIYTDYRADIPTAIGSQVVSANVDYLRMPASGPITGVYATKWRMPQYKIGNTYAQTDMDWRMHTTANRSTFYDSSFAPFDTTHSAMRLSAGSGVHRTTGTAFDYRVLRVGIPDDDMHSSAYTYYSAASSEPHWYNYDMSEGILSAISGSEADGDFTFPKIYKTSSNDSALGWAPIHNLSGYFGTYETKTSNDEISNAWLVPNPWENAVTDSGWYELPTVNSISAHLVSSAGDITEKTSGSVRLIKPSKIGYDVDARFFSVNYSFAGNTSLSPKTVPVVWGYNGTNTLYSHNADYVSSVYNTDYKTPVDLTVEINSTVSNATTVGFSLSGNATTAEIMGVGGNRNFGTWYDTADADGWWGRSYTIRNRKKYYISAFHYDPGENVHVYNSAFDVVSPDKVEFFQISAKPIDSNLDAGDYTATAQSAFAIDIGGISALPATCTHVYVEGFDSREPNMFYQVVGDGVGGFVPFDGLKFAVEYYERFDENSASTFNRTFKVPDSFGNASHEFSATKSAPTAELALSMGDVQNPHLDYSNISITDRTNENAGHVECILEFGIAPSDAFSAILAENARSCDKIGVSGVEIRIDPRGTLNIYNISESPFTMTLTAGSAVWKDGQYKAAEYADSISSFSLSGFKEIPDGEWILKSPSGICSNADNSIYCDMSAAMDITGFEVYSSSPISQMDGVELSANTVDNLVLGGKYEVLAENSANGVRQYTYFTAYHVPELEWCDDFVAKTQGTWNFRVVPEYCYNFASAAGRDAGWYKNGWQVGTNGEYHFGREYTYPPYILSDGHHTENVFYRLDTPSAMSGYKAAASLYLSAYGDSDWVADGMQMPDACGAVQYVYHSRKNVGAVTRKDYISKIEFDFIRSGNNIPNSHVFRDIPSKYRKIVDNNKLTTYTVPTAQTTQIFDDEMPTIRSGSAASGAYGISYMPVSEFVKPSGNLDNYVYFPVGGLVATDTVVDKRILADDCFGASIDAPAMNGINISAGSLFPGNAIAIYHDSVGIPEPGIQRDDYVIDYYVVAAKDPYAEIDFIDETKNDWMVHAVNRNNPILANLTPTYYADEKFGIVREKETLVGVSAKKTFSVAIVASVPSERSFNGIPYICNDWRDAKADLHIGTSAKLWAPPKIRFITPVVVANLNESGSIPWYNESKVDYFDYFDVQGTNTDAVTRLPPYDTVYRMSGFEEPGYYGIDTSGYISACQPDNILPGVYRVKQAIEEYHSVDDIWVETFGVWSSAVLRTPLSQKIQLDYTMTDLAIGPNETITNDVLNRRFEMLQHDLEQVESISRYYKNPPTKYLGYVGYGDESIASAQYSEKTEISINNHYGFWSAGDDDMNHRLDWQWCWQSEGEFTCPSAYNSTIDKEHFSPTIVYGATDVFIDDAAMNIYVTSGSTFTLGGMSTYTQTYKTEDDVRKFRDYAEVNGSAPKLSSIRVMDDGNVVILAPDFNRVLVYSRFNELEGGRKDLVFKYDFGGLGGANANLRFNQPLEIAIDSGKFSKWGQLVYVLDSGNNCIKVFNIAGAFIAKVDYSLKEWAAEHAVSLTVSWDGTICLLTNMRVLFFNLDGENTGEFKLDRTDPLQICANKNANFVYILYDDDVLKISATGLLIGNFSVSEKWHRIGSYMVRGIPPYFGKIRRMATTKFDQIYLVLDNIVLIYADLLTEMSLAASTYRDMQWDMDHIKIGKDEYMQDFVVNIALHRMYDNINLFRKAIYGTLRVYEKNGIKYLRTNNLSEGEFALMNEVPAKGEIFVASNAPVSARAFNDNIQKLYDIIVKLLEWCQANL